MKKSAIAIEYFKTLNCAQSVLLSYAQEINLEEPTALRMAGGFGGGMCLGETCGAVTGAYMVLGMKINPQGKPVQQIKADSKEAVRQFNSLFMAKHGSLQCKKLLGVDISTPEGATRATELNLYNTLCVELVASAAEILEENF
ncbi:MAG TPA: C-GCAxxG-C-C family protein [Prolixibacteraceae bacterium]|nr:C-GCAxxG-C-C family protein [Prolixibacteraceae bacterium]